MNSHSEDNTGAADAKGEALTHAGGGFAPKHEAGGRHAGSKAKAVQSAEGLPFCTALCSYDVWLLFAGLYAVLCA
jgi:hypothetical protein